MSPKARVCKQGLPRGCFFPHTPWPLKLHPLGHRAALLQVAHPGPLTILVHPDC